MQINDRYEFPEELDLDIEDGKYLSENADRTVRNKYRLHSVLVHSGTIHGGHYYAYCNPTGSQWLKFDDEKVLSAFLPCHEGCEVCAILQRVNLKHKHEHETLASPQAFSFRIICMHKGSDMTSNLCLTTICMLQLQVEQALLAVDRYC